MILSKVSIDCGNAQEYSEIPFHPRFSTNQLREKMLELIRDQEDKIPDVQRRQLDICQLFLRNPGDGDVRMGRGQASDYRKFILDYLLSYFNC